MIMERAVVLDFMQARDHRVGSVSKSSSMTVMGTVAEVVADIDRCDESTCPRDVIYQIGMEIHDYREV
jgi:hypothetical protein